MGRPVSRRTRRPAATHPARAVRPSRIAEHRVRAMRQRQAVRGTHGRRGPYPLEGEARAALNAPQAMSKLVLLAGSPSTPSRSTGILHVVRRLAAEGGVEAALIEVRDLPA